MTQRPDAGGVRDGVGMGLHVAHVLSSFEIGGQERMALDLVRGQVRAGFRVTAVSLASMPDGPLASEFRAGGADAARLPRRREGVDPALIVRLARWFRRNGVALVHTHNRMALIYGAPAGFLARAAVVHTKHGNNRRGGVTLSAAKLAARCVDAFVAVSPETAEFARERSEVDVARLSVIPNGIALGRFKPDRASRARVRAELGIGIDAWIVGTVGRIAPEKNQQLLLRAAAPLLGPSSRVVVVGDGPLLEALSRLAAELRITQYAHFVGARRDVQDLLNAFDVFVLSSNTEGLPLVIPEAMATGLPVISTRVGGIPSVVDEGRTGYLIPTGDEHALRVALTRLYQDRDLGHACGCRGRVVVTERFSGETMIRQYVDLYERVLASRGRAAARAT